MRPLGVASTRPFYGNTRIVEFGKKESKIGQGSQSAEGCPSLGLPCPNQPRIATSRIATIRVATSREKLAGRQMEFPVARHDVTYDAMTVVRAKEDTQMFT
ncbi:hypothetical protein Bbelb_312140 [Branchiostoma belcheri]|nr:hypothetical protein Bbelb_312140 [Branchiostoma belcheri]